MTIPENEKGNGAENGGQPTTGQDSSADVPGMHQVVTNPNPRANENIADAESNINPNWEENDSTHQVGSEITDGEDG